LRMTTRAVGTSALQAAVGRGRAPVGGAGGALRSRSTLRCSTPRAAPLPPLPAHPLRRLSHRPTRTDPLRGPMLARARTTHPLIQRTDSQLHQGDQTDYLHLQTAHCTA
jgi:hypothetical protein